MTTIKSIIREILTETQMGVYSFETVQETVNEFKSKLVAPIIQVKYSTLGGEKNVTIQIIGSLDTKETWANNIFENSRYFMFNFMQDGTIEQFRKSYKIETKFRKTRVKTVKDAIAKINAWISESSK